MIEAIIFACLINAQNLPSTECKEFTHVLATENGNVTHRQCMTHVTLNFLPQWQNQHPKWVIKKWGCRITDGTTRKEQDI